MASEPDVEMAEAVESGLHTPEPAKQKDALDPAKSADVNSSEDEEDEGEKKVKYWETPIGEKRKRSRTKSFTLELPDKKDFEIQEGPGKALSDIPNVVAQLKKHSQNEPWVKKLHKVMFGTAGRVRTLFRHIRQFSGWNFSDKEASKAHVAKIRGSMEKWTMPDLKPICLVCDVALTRKTEMIDDLIKFLKKPKPSGRPLKISKKRKSMGSTPRKKANKKRKTSKKSKTKRAPNAFILFMKDERPKLKKKHPDSSHTELLRIGGKNWKKLSEKKRTRYERLHEEVKAKLKKEAEAAEQEEEDEEDESTESSESEGEDEGEETSEEEQSEEEESEEEEEEEEEEEGEEPKGEEEDQEMEDVEDSTVDDEATKEKVEVVEEPKGEEEDQEMEDASEEDKPSSEPVASEEDKPSSEPAASEEDKPSSEPAASEENKPSSEPAASEEDKPSSEPTASGEDKPSSEPAASEEDKPSEPESLSDPAA